MQEHPGVMTGASAVDYLSILLERAERTPPKASAELSRWRAYTSLARQQWEPAPRDQRWMRGVAGVFSGLLHIVFMLLLLWLGFVAIGDAPPEIPQAGETVLIEYIGTGTPAEQGGAATPGEVEVPASSAASAPAQTATAAAAPPPPSASAATQAPASEPPPQPAEASSAQPLVVTETARTDIDFTLPAPVPRDVTLPQFQLTVPQVASAVVEIQTFEPRTAVRALERPAVRAPTPDMPTLRTEVTEVEVRRPTLEVQVRPLSQTTLRTPDIRVPTLRTTPTDVRMRAVPVRVQPAPSATTAAATPSPAATPAPPAAVAGNAAATAARSTTPAATTTSGGHPQAQGTGRSPATTSVGAGPSSSPRPGAAPSTVRNDDWGDSNRNVPGNSTMVGRNPGPGLFNSDGGIRLPGDGGRVGGGLPPGTIIEDFQKIDRMGTWLKRPPLDYTPTRFDKFWVPNRTLLEEWVSRGIKKVAIPIPGTSKRIECTVSLLQGGGGCTIYDPNLQDQEAIARPPPDVPFKPELQEDRGSLRK